MKYQGKTLSNDSTSRQVNETELKKELHQKTAIVKENKILKQQLQKMIKEKNCNFKFIELVQRQNNSIEQIMQGIPKILSESWLHPEITCARALFEGKEYRTPKFKTSPWKQAADIIITGEKVGILEVYYEKQMPPLDEGPFSKEERALLDSLARRLGKIAERHKTKKQLEAEKVALNNKNIALGEVLARIQDEKNHIHKDIQANIDKIIMPIIHTLEMNISPENKKIVDQLRENLKEIVSPFSSRLSKEFISLTPSEINICNMIRNGLSTKEIARLRHILPATVSKQLENIRKKLKLANTKINLVTYLNTYMNNL
jgi:DNA-binding CsgD family transcriptional regulator